MLAAVVAIAAVALAVIVVYSFVPFRVIARQQDDSPGQTTHQTARASAPVARASLGSTPAGARPPRPAYVPAAGPALR